MFIIHHEPVDNPCLIRLSWCTLKLWMVIGRVHSSCGIHQPGLVLVNQGTDEKGLCEGRGLERGTKTGLLKSDYGWHKNAYCVLLCLMLWW